MEKFQGECKEVIIVGAGLAGLYAAYALRDRDIIVLERENNAGGRVLTRNKMGVNYEIGAVFAFEPTSLPAGIAPPPLIEEYGLIGVCAEGRTWFGKTVVDCLEKFDFRNNMIEEIIAFVNGGAYDVSDLSPRSYELLNTFFQLIHPSEIDEYIPQRRLDAFQVFQMGHYETGNEVLISSLIEGISSRLRCGVQVISIEDQGRNVVVTVREGGQIKRLFAKTVICSIPAHEASRVIARAENPSRLFLDGIRYGTASLSVLAIPENLIPEFSYIATPDLATSTVVRQKTTVDGLVLLYFYYMGVKSVPVRKLQAKEMVKMALQTLDALGFGNFKEEQIKFADQHHWDMVSPIISEESYGTWAIEKIHPSQRVFLAGDYTHVDSHHLMPYGMSAAISSGKKAAEQVQHLLGELPPG
ncbi:MAG: FAD-dependent oxidoreductase [Methanosarcinaceae archaeon]|nr:FAD-dependent oxidoreductase [Methanosarcinaceae archaeon]